MRQFAACACVLVAGAAVAAELPSFAGPAMGTTYRVTLAGLPAGTEGGEVHREIERVLGAIDAAASTWRPDGDAARVNRAAEGEWIEISPDLAAIVMLARDIHARSAGGFDITVGPLVRLWREPKEPDAAAIDAARARVGMQWLDVRPADATRRAALRKLRGGVEIDLGGIAPGYAVDRIGARLVELGSQDHLVELGGEVRAWGRHPEGRPWRVRLAMAGGGPPLVVDLAPGEAVATSTVRAGRGAIDPRTGRPVPGAMTTSLTVTASSCAEADAWAVAAVVLGLEAGERGLVRVPEAPPAAAKPAEGDSRDDVRPSPP